MKLSAATLSVFKNFARINPQALFRAGTWQLSAAASRDLMVEVRIQESLPVQFAIDKLNSFLGIVSLYDENDLDFEFDATQVTLTGRQGKSKISYRYTAEVCIQTKFPDQAQFQSVLGAYQDVVSFDLSVADMEWIKDISNALKLPDFKIECDGTNVSIINFKEGDSSTSTQQLKVAENTKPFWAIYEARLLQFIPDDYTVSLSSRGTARFKAKNAGMTYYLASKPDKASM